MLPPGGSYVFRVTDGALLDLSRLAGSPVFKRAAMSKNSNVVLPLPGAAASRLMG
jgi:hypothetical protein